MDGQQSLAEEAHCAGWEPRAAVPPRWALAVGGLLSLTWSLLPDSEQEGSEQGEIPCMCVMVFVPRLAPGRTAAE